MILEKELDFKDDTEILNEFKLKLSDNNSLNPEELDVFNNTLRNLNKNTNVQDYIEKNDRLKRILSNTSEFVLSEKSLYEFIPEIHSFKEELENLKNEKFEIEKSLHELSDRKTEVEQDLTDKKEEVQRLNLEREDLNKVKEAELLKIKSDLESDINSLRKEKNELSENINRETSVKSKRLDEIKAEIKIRQRDAQELKDLVDKLKDENLQTQKDANRQLFEMFKHKKHFDFLSGRDLSEFEEKGEESFKEYIGNSFDKYIDFRNEVHNLLIKKGRTHFDTHFIDNLLISIHQNNITIFAGLPGVGKTSLARILSEILTDKERIREVSVNRGWNSQNDFIGFQNPLTNKFHSSNTGVYDLIKQLDSEIYNGNSFEAPMAYIILDEANLSPLEHYWSIFYNQTDKVADENSYIELNLGESEKLRYPNNLRFIATINYDQTTEILSPRIIDRSNIIHIPSNTNSINEITSEEITSLKISYANCIDFFNLLDFQKTKMTIDFPVKIDTIFKKIKEVFKTMNLVISPRVEISIKRYCFTAREWMREESRPLDYCVAQRLLPMVNLQGENVKGKLNNLLEIFDEHDFKISKRILKEIIKIGESDGIYEGSFNYFFALNNA